MERNQGKTNKRLNCALFAPFVIPPPLHLQHHPLGCFQEDWHRVQAPLTVVEPGAVAGSRSGPASPAAPSAACDSHEGCIILAETAEEVFSWWAVGGFVLGGW